MDKNYILVHKLKGYIWNAYKTKEEAKIALSEIEVKEKRYYKVVSREEYTEFEEKRLKTQYYGKPAKQISEKKYYDMLTCLPPLKYTGYSFLMCEFQTGRITTQFYNDRVNNKYYEKYVHVDKPETFIKID